MTTRACGRTAKISAGDTQYLIVFLAFREVRQAGDPGLHLFLAKLSSMGHHCLFADESARGYLPVSVIQQDIPQANLILGVDTLGSKPPLQPSPKSHQYFARPILPECLNDQWFVQTDKL